MDTKKTQSALQAAVATFVNRESNRRSLITVTKLELDDKGRNASVYVSIYPGDQSKAALDFLNRTRNDCVDYIKKSIKMRSVPHLTFVHDPNIAGVEVVEQR